MSLNHYTAHNLEQMLDFCYSKKKHLRGQLEDRVAKLDAELNIQKNETGAIVQAFSQALEKEKNNRHQLQREYTQLVLEYHNLSTQFRTLSAEVSNMSLNHATLSRQNSIMDAKLKDLTHDTTVMNQSLLLATTSNHADLLELKAKQGYQVGFTVKTPKNVSGGTNIGFANVISNTGNHFNANSGKFTCVYPGIYLFYFSTYQTQTSNYACADIRKNGQWLIASSADNSLPASNGYFQAGNALIVQLNIGDVIEVVGCVSGRLSMDSMDQFTSFTGVLLYSA